MIRDYIGRRTLVQLIMRGVTVLFVLLLALGYLSLYVPPYRLGILAMLGMIMPIVVIVNIVLTIYWIAIWRLFFVIPLAMLILGVGQVASLIQMPNNKSRPLNGNEIKAMSFNAHAFIDLNYDDKSRQTIDKLRSLDIDVVAIQELALRDDSLMGAIKKGLNSIYPYSFVNSIKSPFGNNRYHSAIYSKYKIIKKRVIPFGKDVIANAFYVDILFKGDTVRVFNSHLRSNQIWRSDITFLMGEKKSSDNDKRMFKFFSIFSKLMDNNGYRARQANIIAKEIAASPHPVISMGDFNSIPTTYVYRKMLGELSDSFVTNGQWYGYTYRSFYDLLRIDYLMYSNHFTGISYDSPDILWSDHKPVISIIQLNK